MKYYIGIDLGGTNIKAGVVDEEFNILSKASVKTNRPRPSEEIMDDMARVSLMAVEQAGIKMSDIEWVGVGTPGIANSSTGVIEYSCNLDFYDVPMVEYLSKKLGKPVYVDSRTSAPQVDTHKRYDNAAFKGRHLRRGIQLLSSQFKEHNKLHLCYLLDSLRSYVLCCGSAYGPYVA